MPKLVKFKKKTSQYNTTMIKIGKNTKKQQKPIRVKKNSVYICYCKKVDFASTLGTNSREVILARIKPLRRTTLATSDTATRLSDFSNKPLHSLSLGRKACAFKLLFQKTAISSENR